MSRVASEWLWLHNISMAQCKSAITSVCQQLTYCSLELSHRYGNIMLTSFCNLNKHAWLRICCGFGSCEELPTTFVHIHILFVANPALGFLLRAMQVQQRHSKHLSGTSVRIQKRCHISRTSGLSGPSHANEQDGKPANKIDISATIVKDRNYWFLNSITSVNLLNKVNFCYETHRDDILINSTKI